MNQNLKTCITFAALALLIPSISPAKIATNKFGYLVWINKEVQSVVYTGTSRQTRTNRVVIDGNKHPLTNGVHYGIAAINVVGIESSQVPWPSNRVEQITVETSTNLLIWERILIWKTYTNTMESSGYQYLRLNKSLIRWE